MEFTYLQKTGQRKVLKGSALRTLLSQDGVVIGTAAWFADQQAFAWSLPTLGTSGVITAEHLNDTYGGWPFEPDLEWINLQVLAFHHFKTLINTKRFVARNHWFNRLLSSFEPTLSANEPGCDYLHLARRHGPPTML
jgi:hypothetical protein